MGPVSDVYNPKVLYWFMIPLAASVAVPTALGYLGENRLPDHQSCSIQWNILEKKPYLVALCVVMALCVCLTAVIAERERESARARGCKGGSGTEEDISIGVE